MGVTRRIKRKFYPAKIGHAGTLDPFAQGVLPLALGDATKCLPFLMEKSKTYEWTIQWGRQTDTGDRTGAVTHVSQYYPQKAEIIASLPHFTGDICQIPSAYAACKVRGVPAYRRARRGESVVLPTRTVKIYTLTLQSITPHTATFSCECSSGTYVRTLAQDLAHFLGTCGHLRTLKRTRVGPFTLTQATPMDEMGKISDKDTIEVYAMDQVLDDIPAVHVSASQAAFLRQGREISLSKPWEQGWVACYENHRLIALGWYQCDTLHPRRVFKEGNNDVAQ